MEVIYADLILKGIKNIKDVHPMIREDVKKILVSLGYPELAEEK